jgi:hypothetical protein
MPDEPRDPSPTDTDRDGDSSDVVTGPIGNARLVEPTRSDPLSADLDELATGEVQDDPATDQTATPRR